MVHILKGISLPFVVNQRCTERDLESKGYMKTTSCHTESNVFKKLAHFIFLLAIVGYGSIAFSFLLNNKDRLF